MSILLMLTFFLSFSQDHEGHDHVIKGDVYFLNEEGEKETLIGAQLYWANTNIGTFTDYEGKFQINYQDEYHELVFSFTGYTSDTIFIESAESIKNFYSIQLSDGTLLDELNIEYKVRSTHIDGISPKKTESITKNELRKAACCNLSESFETSPSVDVSFTDAVTGTRQIQMLGLAGTYSQITVENMPDVRGLSAITGLQYIPGAWIEGIQLNKGAGTVINGYESITGQINVNLMNPLAEEKMHINLYSNAMGRLEGNYVFRKKFNEQIATSLLLHHNHMTIPHDNNGDSFHDHLIGNAYTGMHRWKYIGKKGLQAQLVFRGYYSDKESGQFQLDPTDPYHIRLVNKRSEIWGKTGYLLTSSDFASIGFQWKLVNQEVAYTFGNRTYTGVQRSVYANFIYQNIIKNTNNNISMGWSFLMDEFNEQFDIYDFQRTEIVPGVYSEYTLHQEKWDVVLGLRGDYHNYYGLFATPRIHFRWQMGEESVFRASLGRGLKSANVFAENFSVLASSRDVIIHQANTSMPYGLDPEIAWNGGINFTQGIDIDYREMVVAIDVYRSQFENQLVVDYDQTAREVHFYNLNGESYANSFQVQLDYELIKRLDARIAYRYFDVNTTYNGQLMSKPLLSKQRAFINLSYNTRKKWMFDYTVQWQGEKRIPTTMENPENYRMAQVSPSFFLMNAQISKEWKEKYEIYLGAENLLNFRQEGPIIASDDPNGEFFESNLVWGPIFGRNIYAGFRMNLK